jgi:hypothetical protein
MEDKAWKRTKVIKEDVPPTELLNRQESYKELL